MRGSRGYSLVAVSTQITARPKPLDQYRTQGGGAEAMIA